MTSSPGIPEDGRPGLVAADDDVLAVDAEVDVGGILEQVGILLLGLPQPLEQVRVVEGDADLVAERLDELRLFGREHLVLVAGHDQGPGGGVLRAERDRGPELDSHLLELGADEPLRVFQRARAGRGAGAASGNGK